MLGCGLRLNEARELALEDINFEKRVITIRAETSKLSSTPSPAHLGDRIPPLGRLALRSAERGRVVGPDNGPPLRALDADHRAAAAARRMRSPRTATTVRTRRRRAPLPSRSTFPTRVRPA